jgi:hypothetical protein
MKFGRGRMFTFEDFFPKVNLLRTWITEPFEYFKRMEERSDTFRIYGLSLENDRVVLNKRNNVTISDFNEILEQLNYFRNKAGIYGIQIIKDNETSFIYIGKSKKLNIRLRQHLTGLKENGDPISSTTHHKLENIKELLTRGIYEVKLFIWKNENLSNRAHLDYNLGILESLLIAKAKEDFDKMMRKIGMNENHWNIRVG